MYEPALGDLVGVDAPESSANGDVGEVVELVPGAVGVRINTEDSPWQGQKVYFNAGQLVPVNMRRVQ